MSSIEKISLESKTNTKSTSSSNDYNHKCDECHNYFRKCKCHRRMYESCCLLLKIMIIIIIK